MEADNGVLTFIQEIAIFFQDGGTFMYPIACVLAVSLVLALERTLVLSIAWRRSQEIWNKVRPALERGGVEEAYQVVLGSRSPLAILLSHALERWTTHGTQAQLEIAMDEAVLEIVPMLQKRIHYLAMFANIAMLLGLLGTIMGLISAFQAVATAAPAEQAALLSASISIAMNTTAFGLMVGIGVLVIHSFLSTKSTAIVGVVESASVKMFGLLDSMNQKAQQQG